MSARGRPRKYGPSHPGKRFLKKNKLTPQARNEVKSIIRRGLETKYVDSYQGYSNINWNPQVNRLTYSTNNGEIIQGDAQGQRDGNRIKLYSLNMRISAYLAPLTTAYVNAGHTMRVIIFRWNRDFNVTAPTTSLLLQNPGSVVQYTYAVTSQFNWDNMKQKAFKVLFDKRYTVTDAKSIADNLSIKLGTYVDYTTGTNASGTGHIYMYVFCDDPTFAGTPVVKFQFESRLTYEP